MPHLINDFTFHIFCSFFDTLFTKTFLILIKTDVCIHATILQQLYKQLIKIPESMIMNYELRTPA